MHPNCSYRIFSGARGDMMGHMCSLPAIIDAGGKSWCRVHNPEAVAKRRNALHAKWAKENALSAAQSRRKSTAMKALSFVERMASERTVNLEVATKWHTKQAE